MFIHISGSERHITLIGVSASTTTTDGGMLDKDVNNCFFSFAYYACMFFWYLEG